MLKFSSNQNNPFNSLTSGFTVPVFDVRAEDVTQNPSIRPVQTTVTTPQTPIVQTPATDVYDGKTPKPKQSLGQKTLYTMLGVGLAVLGLTRVLSGATAGKIARFADRMENSFLRFASKNRAAEMIDVQVVNASNRIKRMFSLSNAIANITAIKDTIFHKITSWEFLDLKNSKKFKFPRVKAFLSKYIPFQKFFDKMTKNILKITESAVDARYKNTSSGIDLLEATFRKALAKSNATPEQASKILSKIDKMAPTYRSGFAKSARNARLEKIHQGLADLDKKVAEALVSPFKKGAKKGTFKEVYSSYITETLSTPVKNAHKQALDSAKIALSNDLEDVGIRMRASANEIKRFFNPKDKNSRFLFGDLLEKFEEFKNYSRLNDPKSREKCQKEIISILDDMGEKFVSFSVPGKKGEFVKYAPEEIKKVNELILKTKEAMSTSSEKGLLQDILTDFKEFLPKDEYKLLKSQTTNFNNNLNSAIDLEANNMFSKIAESKVGAIATDVMGLGLMAGGGACTVSKGKDKDEKIGATLKIGIPAFGTICTYFYSVARAFSGTTNLLFSAATAYVLNKIGTSIFDYYKKRFVENKTVKEIAKDAYEDATKT